MSQIVAWLAKRREWPFQISNIPLLSWVIFGMDLWHLICVVLPDKGVLHGLEGGGEGPSNPPAMFLLWVIHTTCASSLVLPTLWISNEGCVWSHQVLCICSGCSLDLPLISWYISLSLFGSPSLVLRSWLPLDSCFWLNSDIYQTELEQSWIVQHSSDRRSGFPFVCFVIFYTHVQSRPNLLWPNVFGNLKKE